MGKSESFEVMSDNKVRKILCFPSPHNENWKSLFLMFFLCALIYRPGEQRMWCVLMQGKRRSALRYTICNTGLGLNTFQPKFYCCESASLVPQGVALFCLHIAALWITWTVAFVIETNELCRSKFHTFDYVLRQALSPHREIPRFRMPAVPSDLPIYVREIYSDL
jgi:hypothetical protein